LVDIGPKKIDGGTLMMKKALLIVVVLSLSMMFASCTPSPTPEVEEPAPAADVEAAAESEDTSGDTEAPFSIAFALSGTIDDNGWNEAGYNYLVTAQEAGMKTAYTELVADQDAERILRGYAEEGYNLVVGYSLNYKDAVFEVAADYPETYFVITVGDGSTSANVADIDAKFHEWGYLTGIVAGYMSESGTLGAIDAYAIPPCHAMNETYLMAAQLTNPDATLVSSSTGSWVDIQSAKEAALAQAEVDVDFWIPCSEGAAYGAMEAAKEVGGYVVSYMGDMSEAAPDNVPFNMIWDMRPIFADIVQKIQDGTFDNEFYSWGIAQDVMYLEFNEPFLDKIPAEAIAKVEEVTAQIKAGEFEVPFIPE
jgi:basic membrane protein A and related proteins